MPYRDEDYYCCLIFCILKRVAVALAIGLITFFAYTFGMIRNFHRENEDVSGSNYLNDGTFDHTDGTNSSKSGEKLSSQWRKSHINGNSISINKGDEVEYPDNDDTSSYVASKDYFRPGKWTGSDGVGGGGVGVGGGGSGGSDGGSGRSGGGSGSGGSGGVSGRSGSGSGGGVNNASADSYGRADSDNSRGRWRGKGQLADDDDDYESFKQNGIEKCKPSCPSKTCINEETRGKSKRGQTKLMRQTNSGRLADGNNNDQSCLPTCREVCNN